MNYQHFAVAVKAAGLTPRQCNPLHWQIRGGKFIVNFYPDTKRGPRYYVNCMAHGASGSVNEALQAAGGGFTLQPTPQAKRRGASWRRRKKKKLWAKPQNRICCYCEIQLTWEIASLEHWMPLHKGGGDFETNYKLACKNCNAKKGNKLPHEFEPSAARQPAGESEASPC